MTKYKIKLRRSSLTHGQIERHKDFKNLYVASTEKKGFPILRLLAMLVAVGMLIAMFWLGIQKVIDNKKEIERQKSEAPYFDEV